MRYVVLAILLVASSARADEALPPPPPYQPALHELGVTFEASAGVGKLAALAMVGGDSITGIGGPALGFGGFLSPRFALGVRLTGATIVDEGFAYVGVLAPNAQLWVTEREWIGGGVGLGLAAACDSGCDVLRGVGVNLRVGHAFAPVGQSAPNLSIELTGVVLGAPVALVTVSALLGIQTF
jgi:hypothetical protein